jgi:hypothetical protein
MREVHIYEVDIYESEPKHLNLVPTIVHKVNI